MNASFRSIRSSAVVLCILAVAALGAFSRSSADEPTANSALADKSVESKDTTTRFESFSSKHGVIRIKEMYPLPAIPSQYGTAEAELVRLTNVRDQDSSIALAISYTGSGKYDRELREVIDEDEFDSLADAIAYVIANKDSISKQAVAYTEVEYRSRGGFRAGFYYSPSDSKGNSYIGVSHETVFLNSISDFQGVVKAAKEKTKELRASK